MNDDLIFLSIKSINYDMIDLQNSSDFKLTQVFYNENSKFNKRFHIEESQAENN